MTKTIQQTVTADGKAINKMIALIAKASSALRDKVALCAASCIVHAIEHGQATPATELVKALGVGWRTNALRQWFLDYGPFVYTVGKDVNGNRTEKFKMKEDYSALKDEYASDTIAFASKLMAEPFWVYMPEPKFVPFNFTAQLKSLINKGHNYQDNEKKQSDKNDFTGLKEAEQLLQFLTTEQVEEDVATV